MRFKFTGNEAKKWLQQFRILAAMNQDVNRHRFDFPNSAESEQERVRIS